MIRVASWSALPFAAALAAMGLTAGVSAVRAENEAALRAKVTRYIAEFERGTGLKGAPKPDAAIDLVDLNGDGTPEALVVLKGGTYCGARGCTAFVLDLRGPKARSIGDFIAAELRALPTKTGGWRDIDLNGYRMVYRSGKYTR